MISCCINGIVVYEVLFIGMYIVCEIVIKFGILILFV